MQTIARVLTHHGFGHLVARLRLERYVPLPKRWRRAVTVSPEQADLSLGRRLTMVMEELGPTFIKFGQVMSTRPDLLPPDVIHELILLQDRVPPFPSEEARRIISVNLSRPVGECFELFEDTPFASGSIAQVHRARTFGHDGRPGRPIVVKVKRPGIEDTVRLDMTILRWIADLAERLMPELQRYHPRLIVEEFERTMLREMDFINEAATMSRFAEALDDDDDLRVPAVFWELTGPSVLTLEEVPGRSAQFFLDHPDEPLDRKAVAEKLAKSFVKQFFQVGLFHADPHPGNLLIEAPAEVGLIDYGLTGRIDDEMLGQLVVALVSAFNREAELVVEVLADMGALGEHTDRQKLRTELLLLIEKYYGLPLRRFDMQTLFYEITDLIRRNDVTLPREFVLFGKSLVAIGGVCLQLDPDLDLLALVKPKLQTLIARRFAPARLAKSMAVVGWHLASILKTAPGQLRDISRRLARGQWQLNVRHQNLDDLAHEMDRSSNRLSFAVITAAIIVGSSMVLTSADMGEVLGVPLQALGLIGYFIAGVMGIGLIIAILRSGKLS
ncbi:MAG TPA: AarF/UbiB family protein [Phycisphaerae bacterium]|nr:AarF/UbiB family protein [Phycisphaerae bacterium]